MPKIPSAFYNAYDGDLRLGVKPFVFDILTPDLQRSLLPDYLKLVLHVNPTSFGINYEKVIETQQTIAGHVEYHFGEGVNSISLSAKSGGFVRMNTGITSVTGGTGSINIGGTRRETIAYDKYLDLLALFHNNGAIYDSQGNIVLHGVIKISFDGFSFYGWFQSFTVTEDANTPYMFNFDLQFTVSKEIMGLKSLVLMTEELNTLSSSFSPDSETQIFDKNAEDFNEENSQLGIPLDRFDENGNRIRKNIFDNKYKDKTSRNILGNFLGYNYFSD